MIVELVKAAVFIFPFLKELFLGKDKDKKAGDKKQDPVSGQGNEKEPVKGHKLRQFLITLAILSVIGNVTLMEKLYTMASSMVALRKEVQIHRQGTPPVKVQPLDDPQQPTTPMVQMAPPQDPAPSPPSVPPVMPPAPVPVLPSRDEQYKPNRRHTTTSAQRRVDAPAPERTPATGYHRLRNIDDIK